MSNVLLLWVVLYAATQGCCGWRLNILPCFRIAVNNRRTKGTQLLMTRAYSNFRPHGKDFWQFVDLITV